MIDREFLCNRNINEANSLPDLMHSLNPDSENEPNLIEHSLYYSDKDYKSCMTRANGELRMLNLNIGGLNSKFDKLKLFLAECNNDTSPLSVITLQETHFTSEIDVNYFQLPGYTMVNDFARLNKCGEIAIYVHSSFSLKRLDASKFLQNSTVYESMFLEIYNNSCKYRKYIIGSIYRRPSQLVADLTQFIDEFSETLAKIHATCKQAYIIGDYNIDLLQLHRNIYYNTFYENVTAQGFFPKLTRPTRSFGNTHTLIDNVFTNNIGKPHISGILTHHVSDHFMSFCVVEGKVKCTKDTPKYIEVENVTPLSISNFKAEIGSSDLLSQFDLNPLADPNINYNLLSSTIDQAKTKHIPKKSKKFNKRKHKKEPWMTNNLLVRINRKNDMYREWKSTNNNEEYEIKKINFKTFDNIITEEIKNAKHQYYFDTFTSHKNNIKKTWKTIDETLNRGKSRTQFPNEFTIDNKSITDHKEIADQFNIFFANIGAKLSSGNDRHNEDKSFSDYLNNPTENRFNFSVINVSEVLMIINKLKNKNSSGVDEISNKLLKSIGTELSKPLTIIINQCLLTGIFPDLLKIAKVKPLFKRGDVCQLNNYRPISLLPTISKVFERVIYSQLYTYFSENNLLSEQQYGFRAQHSTELASVKLVDNIITQMDSVHDVKTPVTIFCDLSKAFDCLNYNIFLSKMEYYGVSGTSLALVKSYLTNRYQYVQFESCKSDLLEIKTGIPQGSILGPLFFSILINDIVNSSMKFSFLMYADDTTIYFNLEDFPANNREQEINRELEKLNIWFQLNKLTLNVDKTKCMLFHKRRAVPPINMSMNNIPIDIVPHFNYLGIILDEHLSWKAHVAMVSGKLSKINGILNRLKYIYPAQVLLILYKSLFVPHINYGSLVWGQNCNSINKMQKKAIRTITHSNYIAHSEPLLKDLNLLSVKDLMDLKLIKFLHKLYHNNLPIYFSNYMPHLEKRETRYNLRSHRLPVPRVTHVYAESCLLYKLVEMKNKLATSYKLIFDKIVNRTHSHSAFSKYVIHIMLESYSYECILNPCRTCGRT